MRFRLGLKMKNNWSQRELFSSSSRSYVEYEAAAAGGKLMSEKSCSSALEHSESINFHPSPSRSHIFHEKLFHMNGEESRRHFKKFHSNMKKMSESEYMLLNLYSCGRESEMTDELN